MNDFERYMYENSRLTLEEIKVRIYAIDSDVSWFLFQHEILALCSDLHREDIDSIIDNNYLMALSLLNYSKRLPNLEPSIN